MKYIPIVMVLILLFGLVVKQNVDIWWLQNNEQYTYMMLESCADMAYNAKEVNGEMVPQPASFESLKACLRVSFQQPPRNADNGANASTLFEQVFEVFKPDNSKKQ